MSIKLPSADKAFGADESFGAEHSRAAEQPRANGLWSREQWRRADAAYRAHTSRRLNLLLKRTTDVFAAGAGVIVLAPVLMLIWLLVRLGSPGAVIFRQTRLGRLGESFEIYKFRTMIENAVARGAGLTTFQGDPRVTRTGKFLREYHLDELPQIFNVLFGDMSLVGARPVLPSALATYTDEEKKRLLTAPGITGWTQVNGGALNNLDERIRLDVWYVENFSWWLDIKILLRTVPVVLRKEGVYGADGWQRGRGTNIEDNEQKAEVRGQ